MLSLAFVVKISGGFPGPHLIWIGHSIVWQSSSPVQRLLTPYGCVPLMEHLQLEQFGLLARLIPKSLHRLQVRLHSATHCWGSGHGGGHEAGFWLWRYARAWVTRCTNSTLCDGASPPSCDSLSACEDWSPSSPSQAPASEIFAPYAPQVLVYAG